MVLDAVPKTLGVLLNFNTSRGNVILGKSFRTLWGQDFLMDVLCGLSFKLSAPSFYQVNRKQAQVLYGKALEFAGLSGSETVLDLYCGAGTITLCMAGQAERVIGAEIVPSAIHDARENAERNGIQNAEFLRNRCQILRGGAAAGCHYRRPAKKRTESGRRSGRRRDGPTARCLRLL